MNYDDEDYKAYWHIKKPSWLYRLQEWWRWRQIRKHYIPSPYERYFNKKLLDAITKPTVTDKILEPKPFPHDSGAKTIRFVKHSDNEKN
jgi:hypothetical protein